MHSEHTQPGDEQRFTDESVSDPHDGDRERPAADPDAAAVQAALAAIAADLGITGGRPSGEAPSSSPN